MNRRGFGTGEILVALVLIVVLLGLSAPKFMSILNQSKEGQTKYNLLRLRSAVVAYYGEHKSQYPGENMVDVLVPDYIEEIPLNPAPGVSPSRVVYTSSTIKGHEGKGGWLYVSDSAAPNFGRVYPNIRGTTIKGEEWGAM